MENIIFDNMMVHYSGKDYFNKIKSMPIQVGIFNPDFVPDYFNSDFYGFGMTRQDNMTKQNIPLYHNFMLEGVSTVEGKPVPSFITLFTYDYNHVKTIVSNRDGKYRFENIPNNTYVVIAEDLSLKYNHSIQVGVKPVEAV